MTEKEKMLAGHYYDPSDVELVELRLKVRIATEQLNQTSVKRKERAKRIKLLFGSTGENIKRSTKEERLTTL